MAPPDGFEIEAVNAPTEVEAGSVDIAFELASTMVVVDVNGTNVGVWLLFVAVTVYGDCSTALPPPACQLTFELVVRLPTVRTFAPKVIDIEEMLIADIAM